ncbi:hypothetical protein [Leifsonia sp. EB34]|uniref:hypothetical protein n=1 Tax=Leifsonia sp. EB34 TaxID=3156303 RepID=UPI003512F52E
MTVLLPEQLDEQIGELATQMHTSKNRLMVAAAQMLVESYARRAPVDRMVDGVLKRDMSLLARLEDA